MAPRKQAPLKGVKAQARKMKTVKKVDMTSKMADRARARGVGPAKPNARSNAGGAVRGLARASLVKRANAASKAAYKKAPTGQALGVKRGITSAPRRPANLSIKNRPIAKPQGGINIGKFAGEVGANLSKIIPSRNASGIVPSTMKKLPKGGVSGYLKNR